MGDVAAVAELVADFRQAGIALRLQEPTKMIPRMAAAQRCEQELTDEWDVADVGADETFDAEAPTPVCPDPMAAVRALLPPSEPRRAVRRELPEELPTTAPWGQVAPAREIPDLDLPPLAEDGVGDGLYIEPAAELFEDVADRPTITAAPFPLGRTTAASVHPTDAAGLTSFADATERRGPSALAPAVALRRAPTASQEIAAPSALRAAPAPRRSRVAAAAFVCTVLASLLVGASAAAIAFFAERRPVEEPAVVTVQLPPQPAAPASTPRPLVDRGAPQAPREQERKARRRLRGAHWRGAPARRRAPRHLREVDVDALLAVGASPKRTDPRRRR